ncbi:MAG: threonine/serine exporter family protein, partial [Anaerovorax sp.]
TITRICRACKIPYVECFATTTGIFLSIDSGSEDSDMHTFIKRIRTSSIDLTKISKINNFSRAFTTTDLTLEEGFKIVKEIGAIKPLPFHLRLLGACLISAFFCLILGGCFRDSICAALIGLIVYTVASGVELLQFNPFIRIFFGCALCTLLSLVSLRTGVGLNLDPMIIGSITMFLPGVALTNAARDILSGDMLAGIARATEAFVSAIAIAGGVGMVLKISHIISGGLFL